MLLDLTHKPLIVYPETCTSSVVVRSIANHDVDGIVSFWIEPERTRRRRESLKPDATITRGKNTLYETRLPLPGVKLEYGKNPYLRDTREWPEGHPLAKARKVDILPDPFEVASAYQDQVTCVWGAWRAGIRIEHVEKMKRSPWVVGIVDTTTGMVLSTIAVASLDPNPLIADPLPLTRAIQRTALPGNAWTKLLVDDD